MSRYLVDCYNTVIIEEAEDPQDAVEQAAEFYPDADYYDVTPLDPAQ